MFQFLIKYVLPLIVIGLLGMTVYHVMDSKPKQEKTLPPITPSSTTYQMTVAGSGIIESQTENIEVGTAVPGLVMAVYVKVGDDVVPGQKLFKIDDRELQAELAVRQQAIFTADAELARLQKLPRKEQIPVTQAALEEARANVADRRDQLVRAQELVKSRALTDQDLQSRQQAYNIAVAQQRKAESELLRLDQDLIAWEYEISAARVAINQAKAKVNQLETQIARTTVTALEPGRVLQVNVRPSEFAATPSQQPLILLGNITKLHIRADIDEHDIPRIPCFVTGSASNPAAFARLKGETVEQIQLSFVREEPYVVPKKSLTGLNTERVDTRVLQLIFEVQPTSQRLYVGQQVDIFIDAQSNSLKSPANTPTMTATTEPSKPQPGP